MGNIAYIDNQNLYMATSQSSEPWHVDMRRLLIYLKRKYDVETARLFMGAYEESYAEMYQLFESMGYELVFREHIVAQTGKKKGNVDTDIVFEMLVHAYEGSPDVRVVLISGDGDYKRTVSHLIDMGRFRMLLMPNERRASSLYRRIPDEMKANLSDQGIRGKIQRREPEDPRPCGASS